MSTTTDRPYRSPYKGVGASYQVHTRTSSSDVIRKLSSSFRKLCFHRLSLFTLNRALARRRYSMLRSFQRWSAGAGFPSACVPNSTQ